MCVYAGLFPGTEYQISVQAVKGGYEGKSSSVTGATGQCQRHLFNLKLSSGKFYILPVSTKWARFFSEAKSGVCAAADCV